MASATTEMMQFFFSLKQQQWTDMILFSNKVNKQGLLSADLISPREQRFILRSNCCGAAEKQILDLLFRVALLLDAWGTRCSLRIVLDFHS